MSKYVTLSAIGASEPDFSIFPKNFGIYEKEIKTLLKKQMDEVVVSSPDLIVFPECANRYVPNTRADVKQWYRYLGDSILDFLKPYAVDNNVNLAYSAVRYTGNDEEKPFRNSIIYINKNGEVCGTYDKNHLVIEENTVSDVKYGTEAKVVELDFGNVASVICFDLNFDELLYRYREQKPDLLVHSSMYHGGWMRQAQWAYTCRSYFISAVSDLPCTILNPYGDIVAKSTNYTNHVSATINLDYALCHIDYNWDKIKAAKNKYKDALTVYDPGLVGSVMLLSEGLDLNIVDVISEFEIETLDDYFERAQLHRRENVNR